MSSVFLSTPVRTCQGVTRHGHRYAICSMTMRTFPMSTYASEPRPTRAVAALQALSAYQQAEKLSPGSREIEEKVKALKWQLRKQDNGKQRPPQEVRSELSLRLHHTSCPQWRPHACERQGVSRAKF